MGFFGAYKYEQNQWAEFDPDTESPLGSIPPWLTVEIHDSDFAIIRYEPVGTGTGLAYLGYSPRAYFEDPAASPPTDVSAEAEGLVMWAQSHGQHVTQQLVASYLASDDTDVDEELADEDVFIEDRTARFLGTLGLPLPPDLNGSS